MPTRWPIFASIGVTRLFLRRGLHGRRIGFLLALADPAVAVVIFATLGCGLIAFVHLVRFRDGSALIDLSALFADLRANPGDYWWLAFMLLSTLLPTLIHLTIAVSSVFLGALRSGALAEMMACERQAFLCRAECGAFFLILTLAASAAPARARPQQKIHAEWIVEDVRARARGLSPSGDPPIRPGPRPARPRPAHKAPRPSGRRFPACRA
ncbi:MAG: hypothetical protein KatS3mg118_0083 [Paracoccaceae bacterium]|nr:MAG: hypothetical protein KatS3mg118_0083 [Paracoccaceae bacterium]